MSMWGAGGAGTSTQYFGLTNVLMFSGGSGALQYIMYYCINGTVRELFFILYLSGSYFYVRISHHNFRSNFILIYNSFYVVPRSSH